MTEELEDAPSLGDMILPASGKVAVLVESKSERTPSGLHIPIETARSIHEERPTQGVIVSLGEDCEEGYEVGDTVVFGKYTGTKIIWQPDRTVDKQTVIIMTEASILCKLLTPDEAKNLKVRA